MRLTLKAKVLIMIIVTLAMVYVYIHSIAWRASMVANYNMLPGGEALVPFATLALINIK